MNDLGNVAQVEETRARVFVAETRYEEARKVIVSAIDIFERGEEKALLTEALTIKAVIQSRLEDQEHSLASFRHAARLGEGAGAFWSAGVALLSMIEEHHKRMVESELYETYIRADKLLALIQDTEVIERLRSCARILIRKFGGPLLDDENFTLPEVVLEFEARFIAEALNLEHGIVTRAAKRLGVSRQALASALGTRHKRLLDKRSPVVTRYKSIIKR
jgi:hypothetical protein